MFACAAVAASGCSDDEKPVRTMTVAPGGAVEMGADEYRFDPGRIVVRGAGREARIRITLVNRGTLAHNIHVREDERDLAATRSFKPGGERSVSLDLPPGTYDYVCTVADHEELGMVGKLEIREPAGR